MFNSVYKENVIEGLNEMFLEILRFKWNFESSRFKWNIPKTLKV